MATEPNVPDAQVVREIARQALNAAIHNHRDPAVNGAIIHHGVPKVVDGTFVAYRNAVAEQYDVLASSMRWPDEQPQDERDARIAELERELRELRGTELNPSPLVLDAQAYGELRDEIAATMADEWDLDEAEISILIKYVRWLAAGQPRDEDGYPVRRETYPPAAAEQDERDGDVRAERDCENSKTDSAAECLRKIAMRRLADGYLTADYDDEDIIAVLDNREVWRNLALSRGQGRDGDVRTVAALLSAIMWLSEDLQVTNSSAVAAVRARFADRIAALEARDAKGGEER